MAADVRSIFHLHPAADWHEDFSAVIWWHLPVCEPPYVGAGPGAGEMHADGTLTTCARLIEEGWLTHWSFLPDPRMMVTTDGAVIHA